MRVFSTFTGIGGFEVGIDNASVKNKVHIKHVGYSEIDKYAISVFEKHFKGVQNYGDITKINASDLPDFDVLVGGFPCQAFSIAGKRGGFNDTRGTLFFDLARILQAKRPRLFVFENVKGLVNHDGGKTLRTIITTITELGYDSQWQVLNSKNFGVPQNRERIIIVGHLRGTPRPKVFPLTRADSQIREDDKVRVGTLRTHKDGNGFREMKSGIAPTIPARAREDGSGQPVIYQRARGKNTGGEKTIAPTLTGRSYQDNNHVISKTVRAGGRNSPHGSKQNWDSYEVNGKIRRLTPMECERLQAFPDNWTELGTVPCTTKDCDRCALVPAGDEHMVTVPISDAQRYKMCGNAVTTNVIQAVFERIFDSEDIIS